MQESTLQNGTAPESVPAPQNEGASDFAKKFVAISDASYITTENRLKAMEALIELRTEASGKETRARMQRLMVEKEMARIQGYLGVEILSKEKNLTQEKTPACIPLPRAAAPPPGLPASDPNANSAKA